MENRFLSVTDREALESLLARSHDGPIVLFKHSTTCPISSAAYKQMSRIETEVALIVVQSARDVSREVETRTGVQHESPQALVLRNGAVVWAASHWDVTADAVAHAVREHA